MIILWLFITLFTLIGLLALTGRGLYLWLRLFILPLNPLWFALLFGAALCLLIGLFVVSRIPGLDLSPFLMRMAHDVLGVVIYSMLIANIFLFLGFLGQKMGLISSPASAGLIFHTGWISILLIFGLSFYGIISAGKIHTSTYQVKIGSGQIEEEKMKLVLVSDLHLGQVIGVSHLTKVIKAINQAEPDLVCIVGDVFDGDIATLSQPETLKSLLREIQAPLGVYACLGNHDAGRSFPEMLTFLSEASIEVLQDEVATVSGRLILVGRKDSTPIGDQGRPRADQIPLPEDLFLPVILMDHQPSNIGKNGVPADLVLSGHSHRGQMFPFNLVTNAYFEVDYGYYQAEGHLTQIVVTSGAGTWGPPMRVGTQNEIALIELSLGQKSVAHQQGQDSRVQSIIQ